MKEFTIEGFAEHLELLAEGFPALEIEFLEEIGITVEKAAKGKIGEYQQAAGPFSAWAPLSDNTLYGGVSPEGHRYPGKVELGYAPPDNPLLREGDMRDSIHHKIIGNEVQIGSDSDIAVYQEFGTERMPARSFLGGAAFERAPPLVLAMGRETESYLAGLKGRK